MSLDKPSNYSFLRLPQIIGNLKADPPILPIIPVGRSTWWSWVKVGKAPKPVKLGPRTTVWRSSDIEHLVETLSIGKLSEKKGGSDE